MTDIQFMKTAFLLAKEAYQNDEIPIGAVIVRDGNVIAKAKNQNREKHDPVQHAEIIAIQQACSLLANERLTGCELFVTKEPCAMCAGAIIHARIQRVVIGTPDPKYGACGSVLSICGNKTFNHVPEIEFGILQEECRELLQRFFKEKRTKT